MPAATRTRDVRGAILQAAAERIASVGFHGMSMRDLARSADTGLSNLYTYFSSKEEILFFLQRQAFETLTASAERALEDIEDPVSRLYVFVSHHLRTFAAHPHVMRVLVHEAASLPSDERRVVRRLKEGYFRLGREILRRLVEQEGGPVREAAEEAELDRVTYSVFGMLNWIHGWYDPERHGPPGDLARTIHRMVVVGALHTSPFAELYASLDRELGPCEPSPLLSSDDP